MNLLHMINLTIIIYRFVILVKRSNILYLNTSIRGYPKGLRGASDPRKPIIAVDEHFEKIDINGVRSDLLSIEVRKVNLGHKRYRLS